MAMVQAFPKSKRSVMRTAKLRGRRTPQSLRRLLSSLSLLAFALGCNPLVPGVQEPAPTPLPAPEPPPAPPPAPVAPPAPTPAPRLPRGGASHSRWRATSRPRCAGYFFVALW